MKDFIHDCECGLISKDFSVESYYKSIAILMDLHSDKLQTIKDNNVKTFNDKFTLYKCAQHYLDYYTQ